MQNCIFCGIIDKKIKADIVYENEDVLAFKDINPKAPIHLIFIPKKHIESAISVNETNAQYISQIWLAINLVSKELGFHEEGFRIIVNCGENGGQEVPHLHFHVLAGKKLDFPHF